MGAGAVRPARILVHSDRPQFFLERLRARFPAAEASGCDSYAGLGQSISAAEPSIVLSHKFEDRTYPARVVVDAPSLRWIHCGGTGVDHFVPWDPDRLTVTNSPGVAAVVMAEYALGAIYAFNIGFAGYIRRQRRREWARASVRQTAGETVAVIGLGRIGRTIAARARAAGLHVLGVRSGAGHVEETDETFAVDRLPEALGRADHVVLVVPRTPGTVGLIDAGAIAAMKPGAVFVNLSRGGIADEGALVEALRGGHLRGAALDVFEQEPLPPGSPFWDLDNVIITPHSAGFVEGWQAAVSDQFCENLGRWLEGRALVNVVKPEAGY
jgi:phosphoglycerate dehydrogenase-like enzyme